MRPDMIMEKLYYGIHVVKITCGKIKALAQQFNELGEKSRDSCVKMARDLTNTRTICEKSVIYRV